MDQGRTKIDTGTSVRDQEMRGTDPQGPRQGAPRIRQGQAGSATADDGGGRLRGRVEHADAAIGPHVVGVVSLPMAGRAGIQETQVAAAIGAPNEDRPARRKSVATRQALGSQFD